MDDPSSVDGHDSWKAQQPPQPPLRPAAGTPTPTIETVESAIQSLVRRWQSRRRWEILLGCCTVERWKPGVGGRATWRTRLAGFLDSNPVHLATLCLLLIDLVLTVLDLSSSLVSCSHGNNEGGGASSSGESVYRWPGIAILGLLTAKIAAQAVAMGCSFLKSPGHMVDAAVLVGALLLELLKEGAGGEAGGLLVVVSLWRVVRVVEGALELSNEAIEAQIEEIRSQFEVLKENSRRHAEELSEKEKRIAELQEELANRSK